MLSIIQSKVQFPTNPINLPTFNRISFIHAYFNISLMQVKSKLSDLHMRKTEAHLQSSTPSFFERIWLTLLAISKLSHNKFSSWTDNFICAMFDLYRRKKRYFSEYRKYQIIYLSSRNCLLQH